MPMPRIYRTGPRHTGLSQHPCIFSRYLCRCMVEGNGCMIMMFVNV